MSKPKVSEVKSWYPISEGSNDSAKLYYADMNDDFIMVLPMKQGHKKKYFYGELAISDAHRYAYDIHIKELYK